MIAFKDIQINDYNTFKPFYSNYLKDKIIKSDMGVLYQQNAGLRYAIYHDCLLICRVGKFFGKCKAQLHLHPIHINDDKDIEKSVLKSLLKMGFGLYAYTDTIEAYNYNIKLFERNNRRDDIIYSKIDTINMYGSKYKNMRSEFNKIYRDLGKKYRFLKFKINNDQLNSRVIEDVKRLNVCWCNFKDDKSPLKKYHQMINNFQKDIDLPFYIFLLYRNNELIAYEIHEKVDPKNYIIHTRLKNYYNSDTNNVDAFMHKMCMLGGDVNDAMYNIGYAGGDKKLFNHKKHLKPKIINQSYNIGKGFMSESNFNKLIQIKTRFDRI